MNSSSVQSQKQPVIDYPVETEAISIERWRQSSTGTPFVHCFQSAQPGPKVLINALIHGNEIAGARALDNLLRSGIQPTRGQLSVAFANVDAYAQFDPANPRASRWVNEDMNRVWPPDILRSLGPARSSDATRAAVLEPWMANADVLLDLHTTQHPNEPLVLAGPLERNRKLALEMGSADLVITDRGHAQGTRMRDYGGFGDPDGTKIVLLIECGQHWAASSAEVAYASCMRLLDRLDMLPANFEPVPVLCLPDTATRVVEITMPVTIKNGFIFSEPLKGGEVIRDAGTLIGYDGDEPVRTPYDNCVIVMPSQRLWAGLTAVRFDRQVS